MSTVEERISRGLKLYLREEHKIDGDITEVSMSDYSDGQNSGCDTCGYGGSGASFDINWREGRYSKWVTLELDPLEFFTILYPYIERAN